MPNPRHPPPVQSQGGTAPPTVVMLSVIVLGALHVRNRRRIRTLRRQLADALHEAGHDELTGLPNRRTALAHLATETVCLVGLLDLDRFKDINDEHGHAFGDDLLRTIADRLQAGIGHHALVARLAGDEFVILWTRRPRNPLREGTRLRRQILRPVTLQDRHVHPSASLGLALPGPHLSGDALLAAADDAMYSAKIGSGIHLYKSIHPPEPTSRNLIDRRTIRAGLTPPGAAERRPPPRWAHIVRPRADHLQPKNGPDAAPMEK